MFVSPAVGGCTERVEQGGWQVSKQWHVPQPCLAPGRPMAEMKQWRWNAESWSRPVYRMTWTLALRHWMEECFWAEPNHYTALLQPYSEWDKQKLKTLQVVLKLLTTSCRGCLGGSAKCCTFFTICTFVGRCSTHKLTRTAFVCQFWPFVCFCFIIVFPLGIFPSNCKPVTDKHTACPQYEANLSIQYQWKHVPRHTHYCLHSLFSNNV